MLDYKVMSHKLMLATWVPILWALLNENPPLHLEKCDYQNKVIYGICIN